MAQRMLEAGGARECLWEQELVALGGKGRECVWADRLVEATEQQPGRQPFQTEAGEDKLPIIEGIQVASWGHRKPSCFANQLENLAEVFQSRSQGF